MLLRGKCSRKTLNCRHLLAENNSCAFMCIESIRKCQCINILLCSLSFSPYNVYDNMVSSSLWHSVFLSLCLWGSKVCQLCSGSTCSTAICIFIFTFIVAENAGLSASACRGNELCNKKRTSCTERGGGREGDAQYSCYLMPKILQLEANSKLELQSCQTCFCRTKPKWSVFSVVLLACGTCCMPHCGTQYHGNLKSRA